MVLRSTRLAKMLALVFLVVPMSGRTATVSASYLVDRAKFRSAVSAGTVLAFELSNSPSCSDPFQTSSVQAGSSSLVVELVQKQKVKGRSRHPRICSD